MAAIRRLSRSKESIEKITLAEIINKSSPKLMEPKSSLSFSQKLTTA
jgi:type VI protein secretion system component Hcp